MIGRLAGRRFTLIELLIVISIIAILAAMLLPGLARSKYNARMVVCLSTQRQVGIAVTAYAASNDRLYPGREAIYMPQIGGAMFPSLVTHSNGNPAFDDRPMMAKAFDLDEMFCPFTNRPWEIEDSSANVIYSPYQYFFGWRLTKRDANSEHMKRVGQVMTFANKEFDIVVQDTDRLRVNRWAQHNHPNANMQSLSSINVIFGTVERGPVDSNYVRADGSGFRVNQVTPHDSRMVKVPLKANNQSSSVSSEWILMPATDF